MSIERAQSTRIQSLAYQIWEQEGRPSGRHAEHWAEAERRLGAHSAASAEGGLEEDPVGNGRLQDTPGRAKSASSRQQTQADQMTQTGSAQLDRKK